MAYTWEEAAHHMVRCQGDGRSLVVKVLERVSLNTSHEGDPKGFPTRSSSPGRVKLEAHDLESMLDVLLGSRLDDADDLVDVQAQGMADLGDVAPSASVHRDLSVPRATSLDGTSEPWAASRG